MTYHANETAPDNPLYSVHASNFPEMLYQLNASVEGTADQAGKLEILQSDGGVL